MDYFSAVQTGRARVRLALERLQEVAGPSYPVLFLKMGVRDWTPVGEEDLFSLIQGKDDRAAVVLCDADGNSKAMTSWLNRADAERVTGQLKSKGMPRYEGEAKLPL